MDMHDIKIFVSHRIDIDSELIDSPLYVPVRCGAVFDMTTDPRLIGDDTGVNISDRRMSFCEFTVQYWAWKNIDAEYYGLCHYRRYLSFIDRRFKTDAYNMLYVPVLTKRLAKKYVMSSSPEELVGGYDVVVSEYADVKKIPNPAGKVKSVQELWASQDGIFIEKFLLDLLLVLIKEMYPEYLESARSYLSGALHRGFNCFVMRRELFDQMCSLQFDIMFEVERRLDTTCYTETMKRTPAFIGEILYGIYIYHLEKQGEFKIKELQMVFFSRTDRAKSPWEATKRSLWLYTDLILRRIIDPVMPKGTKSRNFAKKIFYAITALEPRGAATPKDTAVKKT